MKDESRFVNSSPACSASVADIKPSLDSIGIAGFSHNFGTLEGKRSTIAQVFEEFGKLKPSFLGMAAFILGAKFPILAHAPTERRRLVHLFRDTSEVISKELLARTRKEKEGAITGGKADHSVIGLLSEASSKCRYRVS